MLRLLAQATTETNVPAWAQGAAAVVVAIGTAGGFIYANKAASRIKAQREAVMVPTGTDQETRDPGPVLAELTVKADKAARMAGQAADIGREALSVAKSTQDKVGQVQLDFASFKGEFQGEQKAIVRDVERIIRQVYRENGR